MLARIFTRERRKGNVFVESGLVSIIFFALVLGIFDFGQYLYVHQALVQRARASIRTGAIKGETNDQIRNRVLYNSPTGSGTGFFGLTTSNVTVTQTGANTDAARFEVRITSFPFKSLSLFNGGNKVASSTINITVPVGMFN